MPVLRLPLDSGGRHCLAITPLEVGYRVHLEHAATDRRSVLQRAFQRHLRFVIRRDGDRRERLALPGEDDAVILPGEATTVEVALGQDRPTRLASVSLGDDPRPVGPTYCLSPFETRYLADNGHPHPVPDGAPVPTPRLLTDLHTHFAGCLAPADLLAIGLGQGVDYPVALLAEAGIHVDGGPTVPLAALPEPLRRALGERLAIPLHRAATFLEMERVYRLRSPITKSRSAFVPLCRQIARDYQRMGIRYVELSLSNVLQADYLRDLHRILPALEAETGVTLRFLAALSRHNDVEWNLDCLDRLAALAGSRYLVGVDFMGHETNSTRDFADTLRRIAAWAGPARPGFVLRVHAGENAAYPENVRIAVESAAGHPVTVRIGHGLYGVDDRTLDGLAAAGAIVEFNLNSNYALNNLQNAHHLPIRRYLDRGVGVVLGTDGYGIYQTTTGFEAQVAWLAGLDAGDFARIAAHETAYVAARHHADSAHTMDPASYPVPEDPTPRHFTPEVVERRRLAHAQREAALTARLADLGTPRLDLEAIADRFRGRRCLCFAGAWAHSWQAIPPDQQANIRGELDRLLAALPPEGTLLITGGTCHGVEHLVQTLARPRGFPVLAALVEETPPDWLAPGAFTHACVVGAQLYDKAAGLYRLVRDLDGLCLFIGGGAIVSDEIQTATNLRVRYRLMDGPPGASTDHAREKPERAFRTADEVLASLGETGAWTSPPDPYWHLGENPTVDIVLFRRHPTRGIRELLLIRRDEDAPAEPGKWALPGGFVRTDAPRGTAWRPGLETAREAAVRELREETGLDLSPVTADLIHVGDYRGGGRDPRDTPAAYSVSTVFAWHLAAPETMAAVAGNDDASEAAWVDVGRLPPLAFDHARIVAAALAVLPDPT